MLSENHIVKCLMAAAADFQRERKEEPAAGRFIFETTYHYT